jgi:hypothetical protein
MKDCKKVSGIRRVTYVLPGIVFLSIAMFIFAAPVIVRAGSGDQGNTAPIPALNGPELLANQSLAQEYHVNGILTITSNAQSSLSVTRGEVASVPLTFTYRSFNASAPDITFSITPRSGQLVVQGTDISSLEQFSRTSFSILSDQSISTTLSVSTASLTGLSSFRLIASGIQIEYPSQGIFVYDETNILVNIAP